MAKWAKDVTLLLHIGLHQTASSYLQNVLSAHRYDLLLEGLLYPNTGTVDPAAVGSRDGARSGHVLFTRPQDRPSQGRRGLLSDLLDELPSSASRILLTSDDFTLARTEPTPDEYLDSFRAFGTIEVILVLRRQDDWIESYYKDVVDRHRKFETRSFGDFLSQEGPALLDFHSRFSPWRDLVGPENFHVLSYDDEPGGESICRRVLDIAGVDGSFLDEGAALPVPGYDSMRAIDTLGLRVLNSYRLKNRDVRDRLAKAIYAAAPEGDIELMTPEMRAGIQARCGPVNELIEAKWFGEPVPGLRFGATRGGATPGSATGQEVADYLDHVIALCEAARVAAPQSGSA